MAADVDIGPLSQGHSYTTVLRYESEPIVRIPISAITCPIGAARIATTTPHGMLDGWRGTVVNVQQPKEINAEDPNNIRPSEYHNATVIDTSTVEFNDFNIADLKPYTTDGFLQYNTPADLTGVEIRDWSAYEPAVEAGYRSTIEALDKLGRPVTELRRHASRHPATQSPPVTIA